MIIDIHTHIFPPDIRGNRADYLKRDPLFRELYNDPKARLASAEDLIQSMDEAQVDASVILNLAWSSHKLCTYTNDYLLEAVQRYPQRLIPFCMVYPKEPEKAVPELERCAAAGAKGLGELRLEAQGIAPNNEALMAPLVETAQRLGLILLSHTSEPVGHIYPGKGGTSLESVYDFLVRFPQTPLVCAHWGGGLPFYTLMPEVQKAFTHTYVDTAASPFLYTPRIFHLVKNLIGVEKILFGSDYPLIRQQRAMEHLRQSGLSPEDERRIVGENAAILLGFER